MTKVISAIVIIGSGKAALLHLAAYMRMGSVQELPALFVVAGKHIDSELKAIVKSSAPLIRFITFGELSSLNPENALIDVCTPTQTHARLIEDFASVVGATPYHRDYNHLDGSAFNPSHLGHVERVVVGKHFSTFINGNGLAMIVTTSANEGACKKGA